MLHSSSCWKSGLICLHSNIWLITLPRFEGAPRAGAKLRQDQIYFSDRLQPLTIVVGHVVGHQLYEPMAPDELVPELLRQLVEQLELQAALTGAGRLAVPGLRRDQMRRLLAGIHAAASQSTDLLAQLGRIARLANKDEQLTELSHMAVDFHDELPNQRNESGIYAAGRAAKDCTFCGSRVGNSSCGK